MTRPRRLRSESGIEQQINKREKDKNCVVINTKQLAEKEYFLFQFLGSFVLMPKHFESVRNEAVNEPFLWSQLVFLIFRFVNDELDT